MSIEDDQTPTDAEEQEAHRFWLLLIALMVLLVGYPYFENTRTGAFLGGVTSLLALTGGVGRSERTVGASESLWCWRSPPPRPARRPSSAGRGGTP